ncbi:MAG: hypothetical protein ABIH79_00510 [archaeon]
MVKIIIKLGTKAVFDAVKGEIKRSVLLSLVRSVSELLNRGDEVIIVSSGAVGCGKKIICKDDGIGLKQAQAAVGQIKLMEEYISAFGTKGLHIAQFLLNVDDLNSKRLKNIKEAYRHLGSDVIPIVNENDVTATGELSFGDNDNLAMELLLKLDFDVLLIFTERGVLVKEGEPVLFSNDFSVENYDNLSDDDGYGFGGLKSKLLVAKKVVESGKNFFIGNVNDNVLDILEGKAMATRFAKV